jgi:hypothetical protein
MTNPQRGFAGFAQFWPYYLAQHRRPATRACHYAGLGLSLALFGLAFLAGSWAWAAAAPLAGYALSWAGHFLVEGNVPATFSHPLWSLIGDLRMAALALSGRLKGELAKHGLG